MDPGETHNCAGIPFCRAALGSMRDMTLDFLRKGGETAALKGKAWRPYPPQTLSADPDTHLIVQDPPGFKLNLPGYTD